MRGGLGRDGVAATALDLRAVGRGERGAEQADRIVRVPRELRDADAAMHRACVADDIEWFREHEK